MTREVTIYHNPRCSKSRATLELLRERDSDLPFILVSGTVGEEIAIEVFDQNNDDHFDDTDYIRFYAAPVDRPYAKYSNQNVYWLTLAGGSFVPLTGADWALIRPYLQENERLFGIRMEALLTVGGEVQAPEQVYRKVAAVRLGALT